MARRGRRARISGLPERPTRLSIHGQEGNHDDVHIIGDRVALLSLRDAIDRAVRTGRWEVSAPHEPGDAEGYRVLVVCEPGRPAGKVGIAVPYTAEWARETNPEFARPLEVTDRAGNPPGI